MTTGAKLVLTYIGGVLTGIILTVTFAIFAVTGIPDGTQPDDSLTLFDQPRQEIKAKAFRIMQVLLDGNALAIVEVRSRDVPYGTVVLFPADDKAAYFDDQIINVPPGKRAMQVGTYRYMTKMDANKTVPVIRIMDK